MVKNQWLKRQTALSQNVTSEIIFVVIFYWRSTLDKFSFCQPRMKSPFKWNKVPLNALKIPVRWSDCWNIKHHSLWSKALLKILTFPSMNALIDFNYFPLILEANIMYVYFYIINKHFKVRFLSNKHTGSLILVCFNEQCATTLVPIIC